MLFSRKILIFISLIFLFVIWIYYNALARALPRTSLQSNRPAITYLYGNLTHYVNPEKHTSLILPKTQCSGDVFLVVVVCSAVSNFKSRDAIRQTWGKYATSQHAASGKLGHNAVQAAHNFASRDAIHKTWEQSNVRIYFLLGKSTNDDLNAAVANESNKYSDIIQEDFLDTYNNLTLKSVMLLKWVKQNCGHAEYVMKTDDDMFVHLANLVDVLKQDKGQPNLLLGCFLNDSMPNRDRSSKYYVPENLFPNQKYFPPYLSGTGYVFSGDTVPGLYRAALETEFLHLEDVFITGVCASKIGLQLRHDSRFLYQNDERKKDCCTLGSLITAHKNTPEELLRIWKTCFQNFLFQPSCSSSSSNFISCSTNTSFVLVFFAILISYSSITSSSPLLF